MNGRAMARTAARASPGGAAGRRLTLAQAAYNLATGVWP
jgi:hypothetical protein